MRYADATRYLVTLYGSIDATGRGHLTDVAIRNLRSRREDWLKLIERGSKANDSSQR